MSALLGHNPGGFVDLLFSDGCDPLGGSRFAWWDYPEDGYEFEEVREGKTLFLAAPEENDTNEGWKSEKEQVEREKLWSWLIPGDVPVAGWRCEEERCWWRLQ